MKKTFNVKGMRCSSCEMLIKGSLLDAGAEDVEASHQEGSITVDFDKSRLAEGRIREIIAEEGYMVL